MAGAASKSVLENLHALVAESFKQRIDQDIKDNIPTDAATLGAAIKFLKDNNVTADPADSDDLNVLRDKLTQQSAARKKRALSVVQLAADELQVMQG